jgi:hypothetical protein
MDNGGDGRAGMARIGQPAMHPAETLAQDIARQRRAFALE